MKRFLARKHIAILICLAMILGVASGCASRTQPLPTLPEKQETPLPEAPKEQPEVPSDPVEPVEPDVPEDEPEDTPAEKPLPEPELQEDFLELYERNSDIVAWVRAGDVIDYPVMQADNKYYLKNNFDRQPDSNGQPFLDEHNSIYPMDDVLLVYGHNMMNNAMFGTLGRFMDYSYLCQYPVVTFRTIYDAADVYYTPVAMLDVSVVKGEPEYFNITRINFKDDAVKTGDTGRSSAAFQAYLDEVLERSVWQAKTDVTVDDQLVMLITCSYTYSDSRYLLLCRKLRADETKDSVEALYAEENQ